MYIVVSDRYSLCFKGCPVGYYALNCSDPCRNPNYGYLCQQNCNCTADLCNHITGCYQQDKGNICLLSEH